MQPRPTDETRPKHSVGHLPGHYTSLEHLMLWLKMLMSVCVCVCAHAKI